MGIFAEARKNDVIGQDGCNPVKLNKSTIMWTFGDTILGKWKTGLNVNSTFEDSASMSAMISNSVAFSQVPDDEKIKNLKMVFFKKKDKPVKFIRPLPGENIFKWRFWAADGIRIGQNVYVYYMIVKVDKSCGPMPFRVTGTGLAKWTMPDNWDVSKGVDFKRLGKLFREGAPLFGDCVIKKNDYLYFIGHGEPDKNKKIYASIARVKTGMIEKRAEYQFLDTKGFWTSDLKQRAFFFGDVAGELSISFNSYLNKYVVVYCSLDGTIKTLNFKSFDQVGGREPKTVYIPPKLKPVKNRPFLFYYSGKEIFHTEKAVYAIYIHPAIYQPILLRIPINRI